MVEPRSMSVARDNWLTDSRAYNLIWLGRWLERAESAARACDTAAKRALRDGGDSDALVDSLCDTASSLGITPRDRADVAAELFLRNEASSALQCLFKARLTATQIAPVELMRALTETIDEVDALSPEALQSPQQVIDAATAAIGRLADMGHLIENEWFGREALSDEEVYRRFAQQQQQQQ